MAIHSKKTYFSYSKFTDSGNNNFSMLKIGVFIFLISLNENECADDEVKAEQLVEKVDDRVKKLLGSGKYNLSYYTDFSKQNYKMFNESKKAMVVSDDVRCSRVGAFYLANGGNAIDAAVATSLCLTVIEFASTGRLNTFLLF